MSAPLRQAIEMEQLQPVPDSDQAQPSMWQSLKAKLAGYEVLVPRGPQTVQEGTRVTYKPSFFLATAGCSTLLLLILCAVLLLFSSGSIPHNHDTGSEVVNGVNVQIGPYVRYHLDDHWHGWSAVEHMVVFGDSWSATRFDHYGKRPSPENPLGNPPYPGETSSNIANWVDYLVYDYNQSLVLTADFAIGGATIIEDGNDARTMRAQILENFAAVHQNASGDVLYDWKHDSSLFVLWVGVNDIVEHHDKKTPWDPVFAQYASLVDWLYQTGARNFFIIDVPPMEYCPLAQAHTDFEAWQSLVADYNRRIDKLTWNFTRAYDDVTTFHFSSYQLLDDVMRDPCVLPESCEIKVTKDYCKPYSFAQVLGHDSDPACPAAVNEYLWLNPLHITTVGHKVIAKAISTALQIGSAES